MARDIRTAFRSLRRAPMFTITSVLILGVAIGMASAMVTVFRTVLLQPLPVLEPDRIVVLWTYREPTVEYGLVSSNLEAVRAATHTMHDVAAVAHWGAAVSPMLDGDRSLVLSRSLVTGGFFDMLGARPLLGRFLRSSDEPAGAPHVMVLSYRAWRQHFGGDSAIIGRRLTEPYEQAIYTIVGVAPPGLDYPLGVDFWIPVWPGPGLSIIAVARLASTATPELARSEFLAIMQRVAPERHLVGAKVVMLSNAVSGDARPVLLVLTVAVALLLVIACVNVGNLLLLRASARARELAIRRALGARYGDIARQLLLESGLLGIAGGALGLICSVVLLHVLLTVAPAQLPRMDVIRLNGLPVAVAALVTLSAVLAFGVLPALLAARGGMASSLRFDSRGGRETRQRRRIRQSLVASQVALALVMLAGAGLLARSLARLQQLQLGYQADHLSILLFSWPANGYRDMSNRLALGGEIAERWRAIPGVTAITPIVIPPFLGANVFVSRLEVEGQAPADRDAAPMVPLELAGRDYFRTFGIPLHRGRGILESDREDALPVAVVSEAVARRFWPNDDPVGKRIHYWGPDTSTWRTVVGVAGDIHFRALRDQTPTVYVPWRQADVWQGEFALRTSGELAALLPALRRELRTIDPRLALWQAYTMDELLAGPLAQPRMSATIMSAFGLVALLLAAIGLYGVMASVVREQTRELGIRIALGATGERLRRDVLRQALIVSGLGALGGIAGALASSSLLGKLLFQVSPTDPGTLLGACAVLLGVTVVAAYVPARWATKVDPVKALQAD